MIEASYRKDPYETFAPEERSIHQRNPEKLIKKINKRNSNWNYRPKIWDNYTIMEEATARKHIQRVAVP